MTTRTTTTLVALGTNLGDRQAHLEAGLRGLAALAEVAAVSRIVETPPWGPVPQGDFLNAVARLRTSLDPRSLLRQLQGLEDATGRLRLVDQGPRTLDLDIILFGSLVLDEPGLRIPHPRWLERPFVRNLAIEVAGELRDPLSGRRVADLDPLPGALRPWAMPGITVDR